MMSICITCGREFDSYNYKHKLCDECYNKELEKAIENLRKYDKYK